MEKLKLFEAFAGYGSQAMALKRYNIPYEIVGISEVDKYALIAHKAIHGEVNNFGDITAINATALPDFDLFTYSFPCQDLSLAGKQRGMEGTRSGLLWECKKIIEVKKPKYLMLENVKNLVGKKFKPYFDKWLLELEELGYVNYWKVVNAKNCGVPQNRERVFCVSIRQDVDNGLFRFNDDFNNGVRLIDILETNIDEKYYLSEVMVKGFVYKGNYGYINQNTQASKVFYKNGVFQTLCAGTHGYANGYVATGCDLAKNTGCKCYNDVSKTIRCGGQNSLTKKHNWDHICEHGRIRKLTPRECFRLMGVSDDDIDKIQATGISNTQQYKLAGNSIVVDSMAFLKNLK